MTIDASRFRFDATDDFFGVVMQQGRVQLDSDWNEWVSELTRRIHAGTLDTIGRAVVPRETPDGFLINAVGGALTISRGRMYVDGILAENHGGVPRQWDPVLTELRGTTPVPYDQQPYYPNPAQLPAGGPHLVYLDVWQREVTHLQRPTLVEPAVGVDTTARLQTVWQVRVLPNVGAITCATPDADIPGWADLIRPSAGRLTTDTADVPGTAGPCVVPVDAEYTGLENQLYRVEIHTGGPVAAATFKWSRDNGTVAAAVTNINPARTQLVVESVGRDERLRFSGGDWVEITDDWRELNGLAGELRRIRPDNGVEDATRTIVLETPLPNGMFPTDPGGLPDPTRHTRVRRWDQSGRVLRSDGTVFHNLDAVGATGAIPVPPAGTSLLLENGIVVRFSIDGAGGRFRIGDAWTFTARTVDASVEILDRAPPRSIHHHYARLALVTFPDAEADCRTLWPPEVGRGGCDCTACVNAEGHNAGSATIQQAIDRVSQTGGTVCLGPGIYRLREALRIADGSSVRVRGQGWKTIIVGEAPGPSLRVERSIGVVIENLAFVGSATGNVPGGVIELHNVVATELRRVAVVEVNAERPAGSAVRLGGYQILVAVRECILVAPVGIGTDVGDETFTILTAGLTVADNLFVTARRSVFLGQRSLYLADTRIANNLMMASREVGIGLQGASLPGASIRIGSNSIRSLGIGIIASTDGIAITQNDIVMTSAARKAPVDGIMLVPGLNPTGLTHARIVGNRIIDASGNGITITTRIRSAIIKQNVIENVGRGGIVMDEGASAEHLAIDNNQLVGIGVGFNAAAESIAGIRLLAVARGDVLNNIIDGFARDAVQTRLRHGIHTLASADLRVSGNRLRGIGPPGEFAGEVIGIELHVTFARGDVTDNTILRGATDAEKLLDGRWTAIRIRSAEPPAPMPPPFSPTLVWASAGPLTAVFTRNRVFANERGPERVLAHGNHAESGAGGAALVDVFDIETCTLTDNRCILRGSPRGAAVAVINARQVIANNNLLQLAGDEDALQVFSRAAVIIGNVARGRLILNNNTLPPAWQPLNVSF